MQATVAHLAEQHIRNVQVAGSIPASAIGDLTPRITINLPVAAAAGLLEKK